MFGSLTDADVTLIDSELSVVNQFFVYQKLKAYQFPSLGLLDLSFNHLNADASVMLAALSELPVLRTLLLSSNNLTGSIPDQASVFSQLSVPDNPLLRGSTNSSLPADWDGQAAVSLPVFLAASSSLQRLDAPWNMFCPSLVSVTSASNVVQLDPSYYDWQLCSCFSGYVRSSFFSSLSAAFSYSPASAFTFSSAGGNMSQTQPTCIPCPALLNCSTAMFRPVHQVQPGYYPTPLSIAAYNSQSEQLLDAATTTIVRCYTPDVCNPAPSPANTSASSEQQSQYACAEGHDNSSMMCSRCLQG